MTIFNEYQIKKTSNIATDLIGNKIVFFVGAGFSRELGYPGWGQLLKQIISENELLEKIKNSSLFYLISHQNHPDYKKINQLMLDNLIGVDFLRLAGYVDILLKQEGKQDIQSEIIKKISEYEEKRSINSDKYKEYRTVFLALSEYFNEIITTNYDTNLEYCIDNVSVIHRNLESISNKNFHNLKNNIKLYKIHGCITDENNGIIITEKNYQEFNSSNKYIFNKLYSTFMENNIVFIGYSLSDPNIRSLLSEVLDQIKGNSLEKKKVYWVNRDKINKIDKLFYENIYSIQIIDEIEISDFFNLLIELVESKWSDMKQVDAKWKEVANEFLSKVSLSQPEYIDLINKAIISENLNQILLHIYNSFIVNDAVRKEADKAFFMLIARASNHMRAEFEPKILDILSIEDNHLFAIIELLINDDKVKSLFIEKNYSKKLLESLISRAQTINDFYLYQRYTIALLDYYEIFEGELWELRDGFISAFSSNFKYLTTTRTLGYSWESLNEVKERLHILDVSIIEALLNEYPESKKSKIQQEQIKALIEHLEEAKRTELKFIYIIKPVVLFKIERKISKALNEILVKELEFEYDWEKINNKYVDTYRKGSDLIILDIDNQRDSAEFFIKYNGYELDIRIYSNYVKRELYFEINDEKFVITNIEEGTDQLILKVKQQLDELL